MKSLIHVIYASQASPEFQEQEIPQLLKQVRLSNAKRELTGMLVYVGGSFFQVLEGNVTAVESVYTSILRDPRHRQVTQIIREPILERSFEAWTMGYSTVDPMEAGQLVGQNDFFTTASCVTRIDAGRAKTLLTSLSKRKWQLERSGMYRALGRSA